MKYKKPILLVEDNPADVELTLRAFSKRKIFNPIEIARDGEEALLWIDKWEGGQITPAVILLDLKLPLLSGLEVLEKLKSNGKLCTIPVVVLTTSSENTDMKKAYELGANSYIVKPIDFEKFVEVTTQIEIYWNVLNELPE